MGKEPVHIRLGLRDVMEWTGLSKYKILSDAKNGRIEVVKGSDNGRNIYKKENIAEVYEMPLKAS